MKASGGRERQTSYGQLSQVLSGKIGPGPGDLNFKGHSEVNISNGSGI